jgi:hypothetical protein
MASPDTTDREFIEKLLRQFRLIGHLSQETTHYEGGKRVSVRRAVQYHAEIAAAACERHLDV